MSYGYRMIFPVECIADRARRPHEANLLDMDAKYGDVVSVADVIAYLDQLPTQERRVPEFAGQH